MGDREAHFDVTATDKSGAAVASAARGLDKLGDQANQATRQMSQLERESAQLRNKMLQTAAAAKVLGHEFARTGDSKVLRDFEKLTREADKLGRVLKKIEPPKLPDQSNTNTVFRKLFGGLVDQAQKAGSMAGGAAINGFGEAFRAIPPEVKLGVVAALGGAAVAASPFIVSAISGAILAGVAGGGIAAGLILAAQDPKIVAAYGDLGQRIMVDLREAATPFRAELLRAAPELESAFSHQLPRLRSVFTTLATSVTPLVRGFTGFADNVAPGLQKAATAGSRIVTGLAGQLPALGAATGHLLSALAEMGPAAGQALRGVTDDLIVLIHVLAQGAEAAAPLLNALAGFDKLVNPISGLNREGKETVKWVEPAGTAARATAQDYSVLAQSMGNTANQAKALGESFDRLFGEAMGLDQANLAVKQGYLALSESVKQNGHTLKDNSEKGLANQTAILSQVQALDAKRQAEIAAGNGTVEASKKANAAYAANVEGLRKVLINLGFAAGDVDNLIGKYQALAKTPDIVINVVTRYRAEGNAPGPGNSRQAGLSGLRDWQPAKFASTAGREARPEGTHRTGGPVELHSEHTTNVMLDGRPFRQMITTEVQRDRQRAEYRAKVGQR